MKTNFLRAIVLAAGMAAICASAPARAQDDDEGAMRHHMMRHEMHREMRHRMMEHEMRRDMRRHEMRRHMMHEEMHNDD